MDQSRLRQFYECVGEEVVWLSRGKVLKGTLKEINRAYYLFEDFFNRGCICAEHVEDTKWVDNNQVIVDTDFPFDKYPSPVQKHFAFA